MRFCVVLVMVAMILGPSSLTATEIKGKLINGTTGGAGKAESVQLILLKDSMTVLDAQSELSGAFVLNTNTDLADQRLLVQASQGGVLYTQAIEWPLKEELAITVYDVAPEAALETSIGQMALYAYAQSMDVGTFYNISNVSSPPVTLNNEKGSFSFELVPGHSNVEASTKRGTMPLRQQLQIDGDSAALVYPLRPGQTQLMVRSKHLYNPNDTNVYKIKLPNKQKGMQVIALPKTLELKGEGLEFVADDPKENMRLYEFTPTEGQTELAITVTGQPLAKAMEAGTAQASSSPDEGQQTEKTAAHGSKVENRPNVLDDYRWAVIGSVLGLLSLLLLFAFRK